jgi:cytochrome b
MTNVTATAKPTRVIQVWDTPTRLFHWALVGLVAAAWFTGEGEGGAAAIHRYAGETIAGLIVFRVVWGFLGGEHARFSDFAAGPSLIVAHVRSLYSRAPARHLGHNPLGGAAVFLLLLNVAALVVTGLFSGGDDNSGPFAGLWGLQLSELHESLFRVLQGLTVIHIAGVAVESWKTKDALVPAMITGSKRRRLDEPGADARRASWPALFAAISLGIVSSAVLMSAAPSERPGANIEAERQGAD